MEASNKLSYNQGFIDYLGKTRNLRWADEQKIQGIVTFCEVQLYALVKVNAEEEFDSLYEYKDKEYLNSLLDDLLPNHCLGAENETSEFKLREYLQYYLGYLGSAYHPDSEKQKRNKKKPTDATSEPTSTASPSPSTSTPSQPEPAEPQEYEKLEGAKHEDTVVRYERDRGNRKECIAHYGYVCQVCGMDFEKTYGELGKNFIEVHHLHPVSQGERKVNPIEDLIPLCSNCHSMIHRQEDASDWKGLRDLLLANKEND